MTNYVPYPTRLKPVEKQMLQEVARCLDRSRADTTRVLVRGAYGFLKEEEVKTTQKPEEQPA
jgi:hypothetical protein